MDVADQLSRLLQLKKDGVLSEQEFEDQRKAVLARSLSSVGATPTVAPVVAAPATSMGAYLLFEQVGEGGMGRVYRGRHRVASMATRQGGDVAVKLLHEHLTSHQATVDRFRQEAEALAALEHPNIVRVYDVVEESGRIALVMEWVPGRPLSQIIGRETGPIPWERAWGLIKPVLSAVRHAHSRSVIHRDLKPDNIRVTPEGEVKVLDFGIARLGEARGRTKTGTGMGTIDYMAPEQYANAHAVDARADVYALGMTLYEMLAGRLPWDAAEPEFSVMQRKHRGEIDPPTAFYPAIPPWVVTAVMEALAAEPANRTGSVAGLEAMLEGEDLALELDGHPSGPKLVSGVPMAKPNQRPGQGGPSTSLRATPPPAPAPAAERGEAKTRPATPGNGWRALIGPSERLSGPEYIKYYIFGIWTTSILIIYGSIVMSLKTNMMQIQLAGVLVVIINICIFFPIHKNRFRHLVGSKAANSYLVATLIGIAMTGGLALIPIALLLSLPNRPARDN